MGDHIGANGVAVTITVHDDGCPYAFLDHVGRYYTAVSIFDNDPMLQVIVQAIARHGQIVSIYAMYRIAIFLELIGRNHDVVATQAIKADLLVVRDQAIAYSRVFVASVESNSIATVIADRNPLNKHFIDPTELDPMATFFITRDAEIGETDPP